MVEVSPHAVDSDMNQRHKRTLLSHRDWSNRKLQPIGMLKYGNKAKVAAFFLIQNSVRKS
jgi:hypothetical protein